MKKTYMIGNTHFDPIWLWKWDEGMSAIAATLRAALERMEEYPDFLYSFCCPPVFEWIRKTDEALFERIKERIAEGRWELSEGWWVQPDCFAPSGESLVRQGLYGQLYLKENFGKYARTMLNSDSFGHPAALPQILKKSGIQYYVFGRPEQKHLPLDNPYFNWESPDGSAVPTYRIDQKTYLKDVPESIVAGDEMIVYGVTDHGGAPTKKAIEDILRTENAVFSDFAGFFAENTPEHTFRGELITGDYGPYANGTRVKAANRRAEYALLNAEKSCVIAKRPERDKLTACWHDVLFSQFHDVLGGACIKDAYEDVLALYGRAVSTAQEILHYNLLHITNEIALPGKKGEAYWNLVVWNLNCVPYSGCIEAEVQWANEHPWYAGGIELEDAEGNRYDCQIIRERAAVPGFRSRFFFRARIPSMGYKAFRVICTGREIDRKTPVFSGSVAAGAYTARFENGSLAAIEKNGVRICGTLLRPACFEDAGDTWAFKSGPHGAELEPFTLREIRFLESGALRSVVKARFSFRDSLLDLYYTFYAEEPYVDVRYRVNWNEKHVLLKLITDLPRPEHTAATPYCGVPRGESEREVPLGEWLETGDLTFVSDSIFSYNLRGGKLGLNVLRSPLYGEMRLSKPLYEPDPNADQAVMSQGVTEGGVRVFFEKPAHPQEEGMLFNNPPIVLCESPHGGTLPGTGSYLSAEGCAPVAFKYAEDGDGVIIRGAEEEGKDRTVTIACRSGIYTLELAPYEIFTARIRDGKIRKVNMLEEE